jgi:acetyl esterase
MVDDTEASALIVFSGYRSVRCAAAHEVGSDAVSGLPPALIATAGFDPLRDEGDQYAAALRDAGTPVDLRSIGSLCHAFANLFPLGGGSAVATTELISALRAHLSRV